jgi:hypothetical protein
MGVVCPPEKVVADELDCLDVPFDNYEDGVVLVFSNGQETTFEFMPEGECCESFCHPGDGSCYGTT